MKGAILMLVASTALSAQGTVGVSESTTRSSAKVKPMPVYPPASLAAKVSGVVVAAIETSADRMGTVSILQAPDAQIGQAVREALMQWVFDPIFVSGREGEPRGRHGKLTFYFVIEGGKGRVLNPEEMPGGPPPMPPRTGGNRPSGPPPGGPPTATPMARSGHDGDTFAEIDEAELKNRSARQKLIVLDGRVRDAYRRGHREGAINIPRDELQIRGGIELRGYSTVIVDCTNDDITWCRISGSMLKQRGFTEILILVPR